MDCLRSWFPGGVRARASDHAALVAGHVLVRQKLVALPCVDRPDEDLPAVRAAVQGSWRHPVQEEDTYPRHVLYAHGYQRDSCSEAAGLGDPGLRCAVLAVADVRSHPNGGRPLQHRVDSRIRGLTYLYRVFISTQNAQRLLEALVHGVVDTVNAERELRRLLQGPSLWLMMPVFKKAERINAVRLD